MEISIHPDENGTVIDVSGRMVFGTTVNDLHDAVRQLVGQGHTAIAVNLEQVPYIDTMGLNALVSSWVTCSKAGVRLRLTNVNQKIRTVFQITKLDARLEGLLD